MILYLDSQGIFKTSQGMNFTIFKECETLDRRRLLSTADPRQSSVQQQFLWTRYVLQEAGGHNCGILGGQTKGHLGTQQGTMGTGCEKLRAISPSLSFRLASSVIRSSEAGDVES